MNIDLSVLYPHIILSVGGLLLVFLAAVRIKKDGFGSVLTLLTLFGAMAVLPVVSEGGSRTAFAGNLVVDGFGLFFVALCLMGSILTYFLSIEYLREGGWGLTEYGSILIFATTGMAFMVMSNNLISIYVGLELMALSSYVLASFIRSEEKSFEAGFKYFILGAFSSGILLYGLSLVYGATGSVDLTIIVQKLQADDKILLAGLVLTACGLLFKVAAVPFHIWTPDVYEGAPTPITAFFSIGPKAAGFAILLRIFAFGFEPLSGQWTMLIGLSAALTMVLGNLVALVQTNIKRMLAYSSIAHAGYALLGLLAGGALGVKAILIYMLAYMFMNAGAFALVIHLRSKEYAGELIRDFRGLSRTHPFAAFCMLVFMLSLAGIPPTAGFVGKFFLFAAAIKAGFVVLAVLGVIMSGISLYYYLQPVIAMYQSDEEFTTEIRSHWGIALVIIICLIGTLVVGILPNPVIEALGMALLPLS